MIKKFLSKVNLDADIKWNKLIKDTDGMSGAYVKEVCNTAAKTALFDNSVDGNGIAIIKNKHFVETLIEMKNENFSTLTSTLPVKFGLQTE